jgi:hypothetical protein
VAEASIEKKILEMERTRDYARQGIHHMLDGLLYYMYIDYQSVCPFVGIGTPPPLPPPPPNAVCYLDVPPPQIECVSPGGADPNPDPVPPDPHVFGPPGSGSISQMCGSGIGSRSFYH